MADTSFTVAAISALDESSRKLFENPGHTKAHRAWRAGAAADAASAAASLRSHLVAEQLASVATIGIDQLWLSGQARLRGRRGAAAGLARIAFFYLVEAPALPQPRARAINQRLKVAGFDTVFAQLQKERLVLQADLDQLDLDADYSFGHPFNTSWDEDKVTRRTLHRGELAIRLMVIVGLADGTGATAPAPGPTPAPGPAPVPVPAPPAPPPVVDAASFDRLVADVETVSLRQARLYDPLRELQARQRAALARRGAGASPLLLQLADAAGFFAIEAPDGFEQGLRDGIALPLCADRINGVAASYAGLAGLARAYLEKQQLADLCVSLDAGFDFAKPLAADAHEQAILDELAHRAAVAAGLLGLVHVGERTAAAPAPGPTSGKTSSKNT
jgi:hypothetical protein